MSKAKSGSKSGDTLPVKPGPPQAKPSGGFDEEPLADVPPVPLLASGSNDDTFIASPYGQRLAAAEPDPILGQFVTPSSEGSASLPVVTDPRQPASSSNFPAINFDAPPTPGRPKASRDDDDRPIEDEEEPEERRISWSTVLLASYASAVTLALGWTMLKGRPNDKPEEVVLLPSTIVQPESARQSSLSRKVEPPEPILGKYFATIGQPVEVGSLEVTPVGVQRENVSLQRSNSVSKLERRDGGKKALVLKLKLRNTTTDAVFAPLDQAYLRERGKEVVDTFVETAAGERVYPYPLAVDSEWSVVGQDLTELRPGESRVVSIVSAADAPPDTAGPFTWRVRLRTGINRTDAIGVRWPANPSKPR